MNELRLFILGFVFYYIINIAEILLQLITSYISIFISKCNVRINELGNADEVDDDYRIGFRCESEEDEYELGGDYVDKSNKKSKGK